MGQGKGVAINTPAQATLCTLSHQAVPILASGLDSMWHTSTRGFWSKKTSMISVWVQIVRQCFQCSTWNVLPWVTVSWGSCYEHHQYSRPALSIMPLRVLSTVGRGNHHRPHNLTSLNPTSDHHPPLFAQQFACSTSNALICSFHARWLRTALSPTSTIL